jgi:hypothetical protein
MPESTLFGLSLADWDHLAKVLALFAALAFFVYKVASGFMITNMSLKLVSLRRPATRDFDDVVTTVTLVKGDRGTVAIHDASARAFMSSNQSPEPVTLHSTVRQSYSTSHKLGIQQLLINWKQQSSSSPFLNLTPGDEMTLTAHHRVPIAEACRIDVVVLGKRIRSPFVAQWRGSSISLPLTPRERRDVA